MKSNNIQEAIDVLSESIDKLEIIKSKAMAEELKEEDLRTAIEKSIVG